MTHSASAPLRVGIVGAAGRGAGFFSAFIHNPQTELVALCDLDLERLQASATHAGTPDLYSTLEEMLDKARLDILVVGTPMPFHVAQSIQALQRNIHVLSEVPAGVTVEE